jgi:hypothetical protein
MKTEAGKPVIKKFPEIDSPLIAPGFMSDLAVPIEQNHSAAWLHRRLAIEDRSKTP